MEARKSPTTSRKDSPPNCTTHKTLKQKVDRLDSTVTALPQAFTEYIEAFGSFCLAGIKLASLLETFFQETPLLLIALRFREACEQLGDKCSKSSIFLKQDLVPPVKKFGPTLGTLRNRVEMHAKALSKHESYLKQLEGLKLSQNPSRTKVEQVEGKFQSSAEDFAKEDSRLAESLNEVNTLRLEVMGSCFLSFLETQSKLLTSASDVMAPLGAYKEVGKGLNDSPSSSVVKEATVGWLAAAQINHNLRSFGALTRNDVQCMMYNQGDGLPDTIRNGLNRKVDDLLKTYASELQRSPHPHHKVLGGFHLNPKGIEMALRDCCTELEARGAGAPHALTPSEKVEQVTRDVSRTTYKIHGELYGCAMGEQIEPNIKQKQEAISSLINSLPLCTQPPGVSKQKIEEFAFHVLNESCTTVTNTAAKSAVQLVYGKANLVLVRPSPSSKDNTPIEITPRSIDSSIQIVVHSSWWLVEDYAAFSMLYRQIDPNAVLGMVDGIYTANLKLQNYLKEDSPPELPSIAVTYRLETDQAPPSPNVGSSPGRLKDKDRLHTFNRTIMSLLRKSTNHGHKSHDKSHDIVLARSPKAPSFQSYIDVNDKEDEDSSGDSRQSPSDNPRDHLTSGRHKRSHGQDIPSDKTTPFSRRVSSGDSDNQELSSSSGHTHIPSYPQSSRSDSLGRNSRPSYHLHHPLRRRGSNESMSSQSTLVKREPYEEIETTYGIMDMIGPEFGRGQLTESRINAHMQLEARKHHHGGSYRTAHAELEGEEFEERREYHPEKGRRRRREVNHHRLGQLVVTPEHEDSDQNPRQMQVSPGDDQQVHIASDSEVQNVIEFLSKSVFSPDHDEVGEGERAQAYPTAYSGQGYPGGYIAEMGVAREVGVAREHLNRGERVPPPSDNSSSGSSGIGLDVPFRGRDPLRSRSTSMSPVTVETERTTVEQKRSGLGSMDSGINLQSQQVRQRSHDLEQRSYDPNRRSQDESEMFQQQEREMRMQKEKKRKSKEVFLDFSKGPLIHPSETHQSNDRFGMDMLRDSVDYKLGLELYKTMSDDESEHSGHISIPPLSSPSSGSQSPLIRTRSAENISSIERSSSRTSTHSMPYVDMGHGSTTSLDEHSGDFNHAPGTYLPHPRHRGMRPYSDYEYDDRLSQDSVDGSGRGSLSQGSHDGHDWDWGHRDMRGGRPPPHREQYPMDYGRPAPYDFNGPPPPRGPGPPQYDSPLMHERQPRPMHRNTMGNAREDYSPSPGPHGYERGGRQPPMMGGQGPWAGGGYDPNFEPQRMRGGPPPQGPPISMGGHHPPPMQDRGFRPVPFRATTPSDAPSPLPVMSPAPSPHPTPPPTPPPPNPNLMGHPHGPPLPGPHPRPYPHGQGPPGPPMGPMQSPGPPPPRMRMDGPRLQGPPHHHPRPWEQGGPPRPPHGPRGMMLPGGPGPGPPPPVSHAPSPGPPMQGGNPRFPNRPPDWPDRQW